MILKCKMFTKYSMGIYFLGNRRTILFIFKFFFWPWGYEQFMASQARHLYHNFSPLVLLSVMFDVDMVTLVLVWLL